MFSILDERASLLSSLIPKFELIVCSGSNSRVQCSCSHRVFTREINVFVPIVFFKWLLDSRFYI